jgi:hypothetical protein
LSHIGSLFGSSGLIVAWLDFIYRSQRKRGTQEQAQAGNDSGIRLAEHQNMAEYKLCLLALTLFFQHLKLIFVAPPMS